jgi:hypothetical protein
MKYFFALSLGILLCMPVGIVMALEGGSVISLINIERTSRGLQALSLNQKLVEAAESKVNAMALSGRLEHTTSLQGEVWRPLEAAGYNYSLVGENLGVNITDPALLVSEWMASPSHRANILNPEFEDIGVAIESGAFSGDIADYIVLYTAKPKPSASAAVIEAVAENTLRQSKEEVEELITKLLLIINALMQKADEHV